MTDVYLHERLYRGAEAMAKLGGVKVTLGGAGALGSLLADNLVRQGIRQLTVIDDDRVEAHNAGTQLYGQCDVGAFKVEVLRAHCFRAAGVELQAIAKRLDERTGAKFLRGADLVIDTFDNSASRRIMTEHCRTVGVAGLHLGLNADYGEVRWNERYRVPADAVLGNACEYPLARNLILLVVGAGSEAVLRYLLENRKENFSVTLKDVHINPETE
jgi:molybdopterin/thiamine biosynthesis adenylyltransferase